MLLLFVPKVEFLTPDNGEMSPNGFGLPRPVEALDQSPPVVDMFYGIPTGSRRSLASTQTCVSNRVLDLTLEGVCQYIDAHKSLQGAGIVRSRTFVQKKLVAPHRYLVLELRRDGRKPVWLRLERKPTSRSDLASGRGRTPANDVVNTSLGTDFLNP